MYTIKIKIGKLRGFKIINMKNGQRKQPGGSCKFVDRFCAESGCIYIKEHKGK